MTKTKNPLGGVTASELIEMRRLAVEMFKEGYLEGFMKGKNLKNREVAWNKIEKDVWKCFKKKFIHHKGEKK
jgi:hypothetical protein